MTGSHICLRRFKLDVLRLASTPLHAGRQRTKGLIGGSGSFQWHRERPLALLGMMLGRCTSASTSARWHFWPRPPQSILTLVGLFQLTGTFGSRLHFYPVHHRRDPDAWLALSCDFRHCRAGTRHDVVHHIRRVTNITGSSFGHNLDAVVLKPPEFILSASGRLVDGARSCPPPTLSSDWGNSWHQPSDEVAGVLTAQLPPRRRLKPVHSFLPQQQQQNICSLKTYGQQQNVNTDNKVVNETIVFSEWQRLEDPESGRSDLSHTYCPN